MKALRSHILSQGLAPGYSLGRLGFTTRRVFSEWTLLTRNISKVQQLHPRRVTEAFPSTLGVSPLRCFSSMQPNFTEPSVNVPLSPRSIKILGSHSTPCCSAVAALLDYFNIPYQSVEVMSADKCAVRAADFGCFAPLALIDEVQVWTCSDLINYLGRMGLRTKLVPLDQMSREESADIEWSLKEFMKCCNIPPEDSLSRQANVGKDVEADWDDYDNTEFGTNGMTSNRQILAKAIEEWVKRIDVSRGGFRGGDSVNTADLIVFGLLRGMRNSPAFRELMDTNKGLQSWYSAVNHEVGKSAKIGQAPPLVCGREKNMEYLIGGC